jgi:hypothetical protein
MKLTRRELLAGVGAGIGAFGVAGTTAGRRRPRYTHYTYASDGDVDDRRVRIAWYERYNGAFRETQAGTDDPGIDDTLDADTAPGYVDGAALVTDAAGPALSVGDILPGDRGTLAVGLEVADDGDFLSEPVDVWLRGTLSGDADNGVNGPERAAGDAPDGNGELDDELVVEVWRDDSPLGSCNGRQDGTERLEAAVVSATPLSVAFGDSTAVGSATGRRVYGAVAPGQRRCLALRWSLPVASATNRSQGDSVTFDVQFGAAPTGGDSPFPTAGGR